MRSLIITENCTTQKAEELAAKLMADELIVRVSCRVLLLDDTGQILLLEHVATNPDFSSIWVPPCGGVESGESEEDAALRELWEETGLRLDQVGPLVWVRKLGQTLQFPDGKQHTVVEHFYVCRIDTHNVGDHVNTDVDERANILGHKWWSLAEIESSMEAFAPRRLAELLKPILEGEYPSEPIEVEEGAQNASSPNYE